ncbi:SigE family RNA polymerase sigma factor [Jatrophihabitans sp.]|uniref:SigE family RNA polymerase sigma factor n=1 Tax=Jatrophihabitans sp. TaxID=1932789 RepID=UPI002C2EE428|nr:SigE family RNA polymerase sigma factor [Jatrophihabitans sp.]
MTTQIAVHPGMRVWRNGPRAARPAPGVEAAVPDISFEAPGGRGLGDFAREHGLELTRFAYLVSADRSRAEDLVQDVLLAMHRRFGARLEIEQPLAYARRAIVNANISWARRRASTEVLTAVDPDRPVSESDPGSADGLWQLVAGLPHRQRVVLVMRYYLGYSDAEIAETLACRRGTVRSLASRALADLRGSDDITLLHSSDDGTNR